MIDEQKKSWYLDQVNTTGIKTCLKLQNGYLIPGNTVPVVVVSFMAVVIPGGTHFKKVMILEVTRQALELSRVAFSSYG